MCKLVIEYHSKNIEKPRFHIFCCSLDTTLLSDRNSLNMYQYINLGDYNSKVFSRVSFILLALELTPVPLQGTMVNGLISALESLYSVSCTCPIDITF